MDVNQLVESNIGLVYAQLNRFDLRDDQDAESAAMEALWKAASDFDNSRGCRFSTLATVYIYNALCGHLRTLNRANQLDVVSLNATVDVNGTEHELQEIIESKITVEGTLVDAEKYKTLSKCFDTVYSRVRSQRQRNIIDKWKESDFDETHTNIAAQCNVSQSYVTQTIAIFKASLKTIMEVTYDNI